MRRSPPRPRPSVSGRRLTTAIDNLFLAGDWVATGLPPTIESATWSGHRAADGRPRRGSRPDERRIRRMRFPIHITTDMLKWQLVNRWQGNDALPVRADARAAAHLQPGLHRLLARALQRRPEGPPVARGLPAGGRRGGHAGGVDLRRRADDLSRARRAGRRHHRPQAPHLPLHQRHPARPLLHQGTARTPPLDQRAPRRDARDARLRGASPGHLRPRDRDDPGRQAARLQRVHEHDGLPRDLDGRDRGDAAVH